MANPNDPNQQNPLMPPLNLAGMQNPFMPPPTPSPALGFQIWASDQKNAMKVQPSMTSPSAPLQPNTGMASAQPPQQQNPLTPPDLNLGTGQAPNVAPSPAIPAPQSMEQDVKNNPDEYGRKIASGKLGNALNILAATAIGAGGGMHGDPAAGANYALKVNSIDNATAQQNQQTYNDRWIQPGKDALKNQLTQAQIRHTNAEADAVPANTKLKQSAQTNSLAQHGLKVVDDGQGNTSIVPDENSPVYKQQQLKDQFTQSQIDAARAGEELKRAQAALAQSKNDPNSPAYKFELQKLAVAQQNASAAGQRSQAYMGRYLQSAYNTGLNGETLPGAPVIADETGNQTVVGAGNAGTAIKNQGNAARFNDVHGALDSLEGAANGLVKSGGSLNSPGVAAALAQPSGTLGQWLQGEGVKANLTPQERAYVQAIAAAHENVQALRSSVGGGVSDSQVNRLEAMLPNASTPDISYLLGQTGQIRSTAERLGKGATVSTGGLSVRGGKPTPAGNPLKPPAQAAAGGPKVGAVEGGYRFKGGNPADSNSWEKVGK